MGQSEFVRRITEKYDGRIVLLGQYRVRTGNVRCICKACNTEFLQKACSLLRYSAICPCNPISWKRSGKEVV